MAEDSPSSATAADHRRQASAASCCSESSACINDNDMTKQEEQLLLDAAPSQPAMEEHGDEGTGHAEAASGVDSNMVQSNGSGGPGDKVEINSAGPDVAQDDVPETKEINDDDANDETADESSTASKDGAESSFDENGPDKAAPDANDHQNRSSKFEYNGGRRPDIYDAYAHRHDVRYWSSPALHAVNLPHLPDMCLVEFYRKYTVGAAGRSEGKIRYHGRGVITAPTLRFHPEYSSDPNLEGGKDYGKYCRFALVRYRPWVDAPFGRVVDSTNSSGGGTNETDVEGGNDTDETACNNKANAGVEHKPTEEECIQQWKEYLSELEPRMHQIPDVLLPDELRGGGASIDRLVVPQVTAGDDEKVVFRDDANNLSFDGDSPIRLFDRNSGTNDDPMPGDDINAAASFHSQESIIASQSMALNDAFMALEAMRKANLELELASMGKVDHRICTQCLRAQWAKEERREAEGRARRTWKHNFARRRTAVPCLVCASPVCANHQCPNFAKDKVTICSDCAPLFGVDFIFDIVFNEDKNHRRACIDKVIDSYDRATLIIKYSCQFIDDIATALRENTSRDNTVALGSSGIGLMSGITGAAAAAVHIAAAAAAGAAILSPAGPPLFIASLIFGGTAAAASTSSEAVSYYSEPNQMANRLMALHELINSLLQVTVVLKDALINGRINLDHYVDKKQRKKDEKQKALAAAAAPDISDEANDGDEKLPLSEANDDAAQDSRTTTVVEEAAEDESVTTAETDDDISTQLVGASSQLSLEEAGAFDVEKDVSCIEVVTSLESSVHNSDSEATGNLDTDNEEGAVKSENNTEKVDVSSTGGNDVKKSTVASVDGEKKKSSDATSSSTSLKSDATRRAICRATTNAMKAASAASAACGVLSVTTIILEAKNMTDSLERMKAGKCEKADVILAIKAEVDKLPDTSLIAAECESYLEGTADAAQPAALTQRQRNDSEKRGAPRGGIPIKMDT